MRRLVALALPGGPQFVDQLQRIWSEGDAVFVVDARTPLEIQRSTINEVGAAEFIDETGTHQLADAWPVEDGDALIVATSGTSGQFKAAVLTHDAITASARITNAALGVQSDDHWLACLPLSHIGGLSVITKALHAHASLTVLPRFESEAVINAARSGANFVSLVNAALSKIDPSVFRKILLGGGPAPEVRPPNAVTTYGMTETGSGVVYDGLPLDGVQLRIDSEGAIEVKSPTLLRCYRDGSNPVDRDGWFNTNDAGAVDENGKLSVFGRRDDVINTGGEKVWPQQVERVLSQLPNVSGVLVFGEPDPEWGEKVVAAVEVTGEQGPTLESIREAAKEKLPAYCAPREVRIVGQLQRTTSGKIRRIKRT